MQAYKSTELYNKQVKEQASDAFLHECFSEDTYKKILQAHPVNLYTPNYFIRIAMGLLTVIILLFMAGLIWLITSARNEDGVSGILLFMALLCYGSLELFINAKQYYNAGIDNVLMVSVPLCLYGAVVFQETFSALAISEIAIIIFLWLTIRFVDAFMALSTFAALFSFIFLLLIERGATGRAIAPFVLLGFSMASFAFITRKLQQEKTGLYEFCCKVVQVLALVAAYFSVNYAVVDELKRELSGTYTAAPAPLAMGWLFWTLTVGLPVVYIVYSIRRRNRWVLITGVCLAACSVLTIRAYYHILPSEIALVLAGAVLLFAAYFLLKYLQTPHTGFVAAKDKTGRRQRLEAETALLVQLFGKPQGPPADTHPGFGGGSSGGAGASSNY